MARPEKEIEAEMDSCLDRIRQLTQDKKKAIAARINSYNLKEINAKIASGFFLRKNNKVIIKVMKILEVTKRSEDFEVRASTIEVEDMGWRTDIYQERNNKLHVADLMFEGYEEISQELFESLESSCNLIKQGVK